MKKIIAGFAILSTGYGIALLVPPDRIPLFKNLDLSLIKAKPKDVVDNLIEKITEEENFEESVSLKVNKEEPQDIQSRTDENPTYLREIDLFQIPGLAADFSLRVGLPLPEAAAKKLMESYQQLNPLTVQDFRLQLVLRRVIVLYGQLENRDQAELLRNSLQERLSERLEVVYLPECVSAGDTDDDGFYCAEVPSKSAETNPSPNI